MKQVVLAKQIPADVAEQFFAEQEGLEMDLVRGYARSARQWRRVAGTATACAAMAVFAIMILAPNHSVEWRLVVLNPDGPITVLTKLDEAVQVFTDANAREYLNKYVRLRESFYDTEKTYNFRVVQLMNDPAEKQRFAEAYGGSNPSSPQVMFGKAGSVKVDIQTINILAKGLALVDFSRAERQDATGPVKVSYWRAKVGYSVNPGAKMKDIDRIENLMGFQVASYHVDPVIR